MYDELYDCCDQEKGSDGCKKWCKNCNSEETTKGCDLTTSCCNEPIGKTKGCIYLCCKTTESYCKIRCRTCREPMGTMPSENHCMQGEDIHDIVIND